MLIEQHQNQHQQAPIQGHQQLRYNQMHTRQKPNVARAIPIDISDNANQSIQNKINANMAEHMTGIVDFSENQGGGLPLEHIELMMNGANSNEVKKNLILTQNFR